MIDIRKLAALDLAFLGPVFIISEFTVGVVGPLALGAFIAVRARSVGQYVMALYFITLGVNYVPLLVYVLLLRQRSTARAEIASELGVNQRRTLGRYRRGSLLLLIPLVVPVLALVQARRNART